MGRDVASRYRRLAALYRAGVPWATAVDDVLGAEAATRARHGAPVHAILRDVSPLDRALLEAGEATGQLEATLERLAVRHEALSRARTSSLSTLAYPLVLAHVGAVLVALPDVLTGRPAAGLLWSALLVVPIWLLVAFVRGILGPGRARAPGVTPGLHWWNAGRVLDADHAALLALADAHDAGLSLDRAARLAAEAGVGGRVAGDLARASTYVAAGRPLATAWDATPPSIRDELVSGEQAGDLAAACRHGAARLHEDAQAWRSRFQALVPVIALLVVGGVIAVRVLGYYASIYEQLGRF
ncbi:MAG: type II secretion system F family protein [Planctomycetota bacterium]